MADQQSGAETNQPSATKGLFSPGKPGHLAITVLLGLLFCVWFAYVVIVIPTEELQGVKDKMLGVSTALLAGLFGYFLVGDMNARLEWSNSPGGKATINATGSAGLFVFVLLLWFARGGLPSPSTAEPNRNAPAQPSRPEETEPKARFVTLKLANRRVEVPKRGIDFLPVTIERHNWDKEVKVGVRYPNFSVPSPEDPTKFYDAWEFARKPLLDSHAPVRIIPPGATELLLPISAGYAPPGNYEVSVYAFPVRQSSYNSPWENATSGNVPGSSETTVVLAVK